LAGQRDESGTSTGLRIVHVAESFASGTASAIRDYVRNYPAAEHHLLYAQRSEAVVSAAEFAGFTTVAELPDGHAARLRYLRAYALELTAPALIHAHSSKAGVYVRLAIRNSAKVPIIYTPHCYSFERRDVGWPARLVFRAAEWALSFNTGSFSACSAREATLSRWPLSRPRVVTVPNVAPAASAEATDTTDDGSLCLVGNGRIGPQKDPEFFATAVRAARDSVGDVRAVWIGGGESRYVGLLQDCGVEVTGWLPRADALAVLARADVYLHTAAWEGFPISIMEASAAGLPVVARNRPYLLGVDLPIVIDRPEQIADALGELRSPAARAAVNRRTRSALAGCSDTAQQSALRGLYEPYVAGLP